MWGEWLALVSWMDILSLAVGLVSVCLGIVALALSRRSARAARAMHDAAVLINRDTQEINQDTHRMALLTEQLTLHPLEMDRMAGGDAEAGTVTLRKDVDKDRRPFAFGPEAIARVMADLDAYRLPGGVLQTDAIAAFLADAGQREMALPGGREAAGHPYALLLLRVALAGHGLRVSVAPGPGEAKPVCAENTSPSP